MVDVATLDCLISQSPVAKSCGESESGQGLFMAGAPKSREERLREFYEQRFPGANAGLREDKARETSSPCLAARDDAHARVSLVASEDESLRLRKAGNDLYDAQDFEGAVQQYTAAIRAAPSCILFSNRAAAYIMLGWWDQALRDIKAALRKDPHNMRALERHAKILLAQDKISDAFKVLAEWQSKVNEDTQALWTKHSSGAQRLVRLAQLVDSPTTLDQCRLALTEFGSPVERVSPLGFRLRTGLAKALIESSDAIENQRRIRPALARNRQTDEDMGEVQEITPLAEEALEVTSKLLQDGCPNEADVRFLRSKALVRLGRHRDAHSQMEKALEKDTSHAETQQLEEKLSELEEIKFRANLQYKEGNLSEAVRLYTLALDKDPGCEDTRTCATLFYNRSSAHRRLGEFEKALQDANMALVLHPKWCKALYRRGILLLECGRFAEALTELKVVQRADPLFGDDLDDWLRRAHNWLSKPKDTANFYSLMQLPMDATQDDIRKQYRRLCLVWHPDKNGGTEEGRQRFEELQRAYRFLLDDEQRRNYDFGIWHNRPVRHHMKKREKVKDTWDDTAHEDELEMPHWYHDCLLDEKVESIYWGDDGPPTWLKEKRRLYKCRLSRLAA